MISPFAVISSQRSGSTSLCMDLSQHPDTTCYQEIFRAGTIGSYDLLARRGLVADVAGRDADPVDFLERFLGCHRRGHVGFKIMLNQNAVVIDEIFRRRWPLIVVRRDNLLARYSSQLLVKATGQTHAPRGTEVKTATVDFEPGRFERFARREAAVWQRFLATRDTSRNVLLLEYCDLAFGNGLQHAFEFLGLEPVTVTPALQKKHPSDIASRFAVPGDVIACLKRIDRLEWQYEDPTQGTRRVRNAG